MSGKFLICENPNCRFILDLRQAREVVRRTSLIQKGCPECGGRWSERCPHCSQNLEVIWSDNHPCCEFCNRALQIKGSGSVSSEDQLLRTAIDNGREGSEAS